MQLLNVEFAAFFFFPVFILHSCMREGGRQSIIQQAVVERFLANGGEVYFGDLLVCKNGKPEGSKNYMQFSIER